MHDGTVSAIWGERGRSEILPVVVVKDIDPRLLDAFRYAFSDARRREVVGDDAACSATSSSSQWRRGG